MDYLPEWMIDWPFPTGIAALVVAIFAYWGDRRRMRRIHPDAVGFMPWRDVAFWASLLAIVALGFGVREWLAA